MTKSGETSTQPGVEPPPSAVAAFPRPWQPLTPRGAAAFAHTSLNRVCAFQLAVAGVLALSFAWFLQAAVFPVVHRSVLQLPETGVIELGELRLPAQTPVMVAENDWLALRVDLESPGDQSLVRDLEIRFGPNSVRACTGLGCMTFIYPPGWTIPFNRLEVVPWWEAWETVLTATGAFSLFCFLLVTWWTLSTLYAPLPRVLAFFSDRELSLDGAWRMAAASLLAGAIFMGLGILALGMGWIRLTTLLLFFLVHLTIPIVYVVVGTSVLPPRSRISKGPNPFNETAALSTPSSSQDRKGDASLAPPASPASNPPPAPLQAAPEAEMESSPRFRLNPFQSAPASTDSKPRRKPSNPFRGR